MQDLAVAAHMLECCSVAHTSSYVHLIDGDVDFNRSRFIMAYRKVITEVLDLPFNQQKASRRGKKKSFSFHVKKGCECRGNCVSPIPPLD